MPRGSQRATYDRRSMGVERNSQCIFNGSNGSQQVIRCNGQNPWRKTRRSLGWSLERVSIRPRPHQDTLLSNSVSGCRETDPGIQLLFNGRTTIAGHLFHTYVQTKILCCATLTQQSIWNGARQLLSICTTPNLLPSCCSAAARHNFACVHVSRWIR